MLELRHARVLAADGEQLEIEIEGERVRAWADAALVGPCAAGDDVVVNVQARRLGLGSGGFDLVHCNLTRGLGATAEAGTHVMKLNYTSLQHAVAPVEATAGEPLLPLGRPAGVLMLHGQLAPVAWAFGQAAPGARVGFVQAAGGALPGALSDVVRELRARELLAGHVTAGAAYGGEAEAVTTAGALQHGLGAAGWDAALVGPGPGIIGSGSALGHGGLAALDALHTALALGCPPLLAARMSDADPRERHRGLSHHAETVLGLALAPVVVAAPAGHVPPEAGRHDWREVGGTEELARAYIDSGLPATTMGRDDRLFLAAALAAGTALAGMISGA